MRFWFLPRQRRLTLARLLWALKNKCNNRRRNLSLRSRRQNRAWGGASAEPQEYGVSTHQAREVGGSFLSCAISSSLRLGQWLSPASQACAINPDRTWGSATLHPRLHSAARIRGLRTRQNVGNDKPQMTGLKSAAASAARRRSSPVQTKVS